MRGVHSDAQGQRLIKAGKTVETKEENLSALLDMAVDFHGKRLPIMKALGIAQYTLPLLFYPALVHGHASKAAGENQQHPQN